MTEAAAAPRRSGSRWKLALRIVVSLTLLALLVTKAEDFSFRDVIPKEHHTLTVALLIAAVLMGFFGVVLSAWRWQRVLLLFDAWVSIRALTSIYLVGLLVGNVLPSTIGGDVVRVARASGPAGSTSVSFASVVIERLTGFIALPLLVCVGFAMDPSLIHHAHAWIALLVAGVTLVALIVILVLAGHPRIAGRYAEHENWARWIGAVHRGIERIRREPRNLVPVLGTALIYQASVVAMFGLIFRALELPVPTAAVIAFSPAVLMLQVLPISFAGLGVREGALKLFLQSFGVTDTRAFAAGLLWYGCMLLVSVLGVPALILGTPESKPAVVGEPA